jgi:hypothetical protein
LSTGATGFFILPLASALPGIALQGGGKVVKLKACYGAAGVLLSAVAFGGGSRTMAKMLCQNCGREGSSPFCPYCSTATIQATQVTIPPKPSSPIATPFTRTGCALAIFGAVIAHPVLFILAFLWGAVFGCSDGIMASGPVTKHFGMAGGKEAVGILAFYYMFFGRDAPAVRF